MPPQPYLQWHPAMAPRPLPQSWSSPSPLQWHRAMAPSNGTTSTPPKMVVTLPNHSTLQWHPTMALSNGTLVPRPIPQSGSSPSPPIGSKNPYSYRWGTKKNNQNVAKAENLWLKKSLLNPPNQKKTNIWHPAIRLLHHRHELGPHRRILNFVEEMSDDFRKILKTSLAFSKQNLAFFLLEMKKKPVDLLGEAYLFWRIPPYVVPSLVAPHSDRRILLPLSSLPWLRKKSELPKLLSNQSASCKSGMCTLPQVGMKMSPRNFVFQLFALNNLFQLEKSSIWPISNPNSEKKKK